MPKQTVYIGADHAGFALKQKLVPFLKRLGFRVVDKGAKKLVPTDDYPDYGAAVAREVAVGRGVGVLVCGSSQGVCVAANKFRGVHAVSVSTVRDTKLAREHGNANVLCLSGWHTSPSRAKKIIKTFLETSFSGAARHVRRLKKIAKLER